MHGIDEGKWLAFLSGTPCLEVERHLLLCVECGETWKQMRAWQKALQVEAACLFPVPRLIQLRAIFLATAMGKHSRSLPRTRGPSGLTKPKPRS